MAATFDSFLADALCLPVEQRSRLASVLIESLDADDDSGLSPAWKAEVTRRARELDEGGVKPVSFEEFRHHVEECVS